MEDFTANSEDSSSSTNDVGAGGAAGFDAGQSTAESQAPAQTAPESTEESFSPGWSLDETESTEDIPETDDDIQEMLTDPKLDQQRAPKLVEDLRATRGMVRTLKGEIAGLKQQLGQLDSYGGYETAVEALPLVSTLLQPADGDTSTLPFLDALHGASYPRFEQLVNDVITQYADHAVSKLQELGMIPAGGFPQGQSVGDIDPNILATVADNLQSQYKNTPDQVRAEYDIMTPAMRNHFLERDAKMAQMETGQREAAQQQWQQQFQSAQVEGQKAVENIQTQYEQAHFKELSKWAPYGPDNAQANQRLHGEIVEGAWRELLADSKFAQMYQDCQALVAGAPMHRLANDKFRADADARQGHQLARQLNTRLGQIIASRVKERDGVYQDARKWREYQRQQAPERTEIPGRGTTAANGKVRTLNDRGEISDEYMNALKANLGVRR